MTVRMTQAQVDQMVTHARRIAPDECCGMLLGRGDTVEDVIAARNIERHRGGLYLMHPEDQKNAMLQMVRNNQELVGIYHSHPFGGAYPSGIDTGRSSDAGLSGARYVIVGLGGWGWGGWRRRRHGGRHGRRAYYVPERPATIRAFRLINEADEEDVHEEPIIVTGGAILEDGEKVVFDPKAMVVDQPYFYLFLGQTWAVVKRENETLDFHYLPVEEEPQWFERLLPPPRRR